MTEIEELESKIANRRALVRITEHAILELEALLREAKRKEAEKVKK